jgi:predicted metal-dependent peptidase
VDEGQLQVSVNKENNMAYLTDEERLKKQHIVLMRHHETALYGSIMMMGESAVEDGIPTAYTDGENKKYGKAFMSKLTDDEARGLIMHENLHVALMHIPRHKDLMKEDHTLANVAMDIVVNNIIDNLTDKTLCKLPQGAILDHAFDGWSVREIYNELKKQNPQRKKPEGQPQDNGSGEGEPINVNGKQYDVSGMDEHDGTGKTLTHEEAKEFEEKVGRALREGGILAGRLGAKIPREITASLDKPIDWKEAMREFVTSAVRGKDEFTWRRFNRSLLANDILAPSVESETMTEVIFCGDSSGSITQEMFGKVAFQLQLICDSVNPETVRVLWWDTEVHGEQVFGGDSPNVKDILKPMGGGGTRVSCVSEYIVKKGYKPDCIVVFTDGYVEDKVEWVTGVETLWLVTENRSFVPPKGKMVKIDKL